MHKKIYIFQHALIGTLLLFAVPAAMADNNDSAVKRDNFAKGKALKSEDLQNEQQYNAQKNRPGMQKAKEFPLQKQSKDTRKIFRPFNIATEKLTVSGKPFKPVSITAEKLTVSGKLFKPVDITAEKLTVSGKPPTQENRPLKIDKELKNFQRKGIK